MSSGANEWLGDLLTAAKFLTRLPLARTQSSASLASAARCFPVIGVAIGAAGALAYWLSDAILGLAALPAALLAVLATVLATGALHEDGLADTADGLGGGRDAEHALAIMRDSRSGAYGVLALVFSVGLRAAALAAIADPGAVLAALLAAHAMSRGALPMFMRGFDPARPDGLGAAAGRPAPEAALWAAGIGGVVTLGALGIGWGLIALVAVATLLALLRGVARRRIGGYTGDVLGAAQQLAETALLLIASAA